VIQRSKKQNLAFGRSAQKNAKKIDKNSNNNSKDLKKYSSRGTIPLKDILVVLVLS
jgi:hypothetical protein